MGRLWKTQRGPSNWMPSTWRWGCDLFNALHLRNSFILWKWCDWERNERKAIFRCDLAPPLIIQCGLSWSPPDRPSLTLIKVSIISTVTVFWIDIDIFFSWAPNLIPCALKPAWSRRRGWSSWMSEIEHFSILRWLIYFLRAVYTSYSDFSLNYVHVRQILFSGWKCGR